MFENLVSKTDGNQASEQSNFANQAWEPTAVAEASAGANATDAQKPGPTKKPDALKQHIDINERCSLDIYEHHWDLKMPIVASSVTGVEIVNEKGKFKLVPQEGPAELTTDTLSMDDAGIWTMKDAAGNSIDMRRQFMKEYPADPKHPEKKVEFKQKNFENGTVVLVDPSNNFILIHHQKHEFKNKEGTPEYVAEFMKNELVVEFNKKSGVTSVMDLGKRHLITDVVKRP